MNRFNRVTLFIIALLFVAALFAGHGRAPAAGTAKLGAVDFIVSNAGDAGPGTLRDAILAADRVSNRARVLVKVKQVTIESALPALVNPHGVSVEAEPGFGLIDASHQLKGATLQINGPASVLRGIGITHARDFGIVVSAPGVQLDSISIANSRVGIVLGEAAKNTGIHTSTFEHDETAITADAGVRDVTILSSIFRNNTKAAFWFVGAVDKKGTAAPRNAADGETAPEWARIVDSVFEKNAQGVVLANRPTLIQKCRFFGNLQSALLILGGSARVEDSEIRATGGNAISVSSSKLVVLARNTLDGNPSTAIMVRDSQVTIEHNTLQGNGFGIVVISSQNSDGTIVRDNLVTKSTADAVTIIGGTPHLAHNQILENRGAGFRILDLVSTGRSLKAAPVLDANVMKSNGMDMPPAAVYKLAGTLAP